ALADLRGAAKPDDEVNLRRILNVPLRPSGDRTEALTGHFAERAGIRFPPALGRLGHSPPLRPGAPTSVQKSYALPQDLASTAESSPLSRVIEAILERSGYLESLQKSTDPQDESRVDNLAELVAVAEDFVASREAAATSEADTDTETDDASAAAAEEAPPAPGVGVAAIDQFLEQVALASDTDQIPDAELGQVTLMTLHTAKGLEFPVSSSPDSRTVDSRIPGRSRTR